MRNVMTFICVVCAATSLFASDALRVARRKSLTANVGVVSVGLDTYWKQCPGLLEDLMKKEDVFVAKLNAHSVRVSRFGMSDNPKKAASMIPAMKAADLDILFIDMVTYATSSTFPPDVRTFLRRWSLEGPTHHFALGIGHHAAEVKKLGRALGIETVVVTE